MRRLSYALAGLALLAGTASAEVLYIAGETGLEIRETAAADSAVVGRVTSRTPLQVVGRENGVVQVQAPDGTVGWADEEQLGERPPAGLVLEQLSEAQREAWEEIALLQGQLEVKQAQLEALPAQPEPQAEGDASEAASAERQALAGEVAELRTRIERLRGLAAAGEGADAEALRAEFDQLREENTALRTRIASAQSLLEGKGVPTPEALARVRPGLPRWVWGAMVVALVLGAVIGASWLDWRYRRRHGGFRI